MDATSILPSLNWSVTPSVTKNVSPFQSILSNNRLLGFDTKPKTSSKRHTAPPTSSRTPQTPTTSSKKRVASVEEDFDDLNEDDTETAAIQTIGEFKPPSKPITEYKTYIKLIKSTETTIAIVGGNGVSKAFDGNVEGTAPKISLITSQLNEKDPFNTLTFIKMMQVKTATGDIQPAEYEYKDPILLVKNYYKAELRKKNRKISEAEVATELDKLNWGPEMILDLIQLRTKEADASINIKSLRELAAMFEEDSKVMEIYNKDVKEKEAEHRAKVEIEKKKLEEQKRQAEILAQKREEMIRIVREQEARKLAGKISAIDFYLKNQDMFDDAVLNAIRNIKDNKSALENPEVVALLADRVVARKTKSRKTNEVSTDLDNNNNNTTPKETVTNDV